MSLIHQALPDLNSPLPGISNKGLFSTVIIWQRGAFQIGLKSAHQLSLPLLEYKGEELIKNSGFDIDNLTGSGSILKSNGNKQALAIFLQDNEVPEIQNERFNRNSPVTYALTIADQESLPYIVLTKGSQIRLYCSEAGKGVGRKGRAETYFEINLSLLPDDLAGYLSLIFSPEALKRKRFY